MAQIIHADGSIISQDQKRNQLGYTRKKLDNTKLKC